MVPNCLDLASYYTNMGHQHKEKFYHLRGLEVPCFALTSPVAGSDAGSIPDFGIVVSRTINRRQVLGFEVTLRKRYITLAPVATLVGLAFKAHDPDQLLGEADLGITCALISGKTEGLHIGQRHNPAETGFYNGPIFGEKIFVPLTAIGEEDGVGHGWQMLMECLAVGRGVSLPGMAAGGAKLMLMTTSAYARIRYQFNRPIGQCEAIAEKVGEIAVEAYTLNALRLFFVSALEMGRRPAVAAAMTKYRNTEGCAKSLRQQWMFMLERLYALVRATISLMYIRRYQWP